MLATDPPAPAAHIRDIIYTHHADVLNALRELQSQREGASETATGDANRAPATIQ